MNIYNKKSVMTVATAFLIFSLTEVSLSHRFHFAETGNWAKKRNIYRL